MISEKSIALYRERLETAILRLEYYPKPDVVVQVGSAGLGNFVSTYYPHEDDGYSIYKNIPYHELGFPVPTVENHEGQLIIMKLSAGKEKQKIIFLLQGRHHYYESGSAHQTAFIVRACVGAGARHFILLNAAGGLSSRLKVGSVMAIADCAGNIPSPNIAYHSTSKRFVNCSKLFDQEWYMKARNYFDTDGNYFAIQGPEYESPCTASELKRKEYDAVGMSTVPEVWAIKAEAPDTKVVGVSLITNHHFLSGAENVSHEEVAEVSRRNERRLTDLVDQLIRVM